ncbi:InlB B-repeat-containing protein, partial [Candidatus Magnetobacterium casense]
MRNKAMFNAIAIFIMISFFLAGSAAAGTYTFYTKWGGSGNKDAQFAAPIDVAADMTGNVYVVDKDNHRIQKFTKDGQFVSSWGSFGTGNGQFSSPFGIAVDAAGDVYVADTGNDRIQVFNSTGTFITAWGSSGTGNGQFSSPHRIAVGAVGTAPTDVYVTDTANNRVQRFSTRGGFLGAWGSSGSGDGQFSTPKGIAVDTAGNVYVVDYDNSRIQKFSSTGAFITKWGNNSPTDGNFNVPYGVTVDRAGNVYVADYGNNRIQQFNSTGTFIAKWGSAGLEDGQFDSAAGISIDASNDVYVADEKNNRIQKFTTSAVALPIPMGFAITQIDGGLRLNWNAVVGANTYVIYWGEDLASVNETNNSGAFTTNNTSYDHTGLKNGSTYYYRIKSSNGTTTSSISGVISMTYQVNTLNVTLAGTGTGTVTASSGILTWTGKSGTATYTSGTVVTLTATPTTGSVFSSWTGCDTVSANQCTVTMNAAKNVTATFAVQQG